MSDFVIPTRQKTDVLSQSSTPIAAAGSFTSKIVRVDGYNQIGILAISDQAFTITIKQAAALPPNLAQPQQAVLPVPTPPPAPSPTPEVAPDPPPLGVGTFVTTQTLASVAVAGVQQVSTRIQPTGPFMRMTIAPSGAGQTTLSFGALGIPLP